MWLKRKQPNQLNANPPVSSYDYAAEQEALLSLAAFDLDQSELGSTSTLPSNDLFDGWSREEASLLNPDNDEDKALAEVAEQTTYGTIFLNELIKRQRALSMSVAFIFLILIFSFPLLSFLGPELVSMQIFGMPANWLLLGVMIYPLVWLLAFFFVNTADKYEDDFTDLVNGSHRHEK
jgi:uncharacterized membrane protein (DUF485 family)